MRVGGRFRVLLLRGLASRFRGGRWRYEAFFGFADGVAGFVQGGGFFAVVVFEEESVS
jgi:hypothetical protein